MKSKLEGKLRTEIDNQKFKKRVWFTLALIFLVVLPLATLTIYENSQYPIMEEKFIAMGENNIINDIKFVCINKTEIRTVEYYTKVNESMVAETCNDFCDKIIKDKAFSGILDRLHSIDNCKYHCENDILEEYYTTENNNPERLNHTYAVANNMTYTINQTFIEEKCIQKLYIIDPIDIDFYKRIYDQKISRTYYLPRYYENIEE